MFENMFRIGQQPEVQQQMKAAEQSEKRNMQFQKEQSLFTVGAAPQTDMVDIPQINERSDLIKWQQDLDPELIDLVYKLKGYVNINGVWQKPSTEWHPLCNDKFIQKVVIPRCKPYISRNLINSNFTEERILMMLERTANDIADNMADGYDQYKIDFIDYDDVLSTIKDTIIPGAFRALHGWTKKTDSTNFKRIESSLENTQEEKNKRMFGFAK